jgi:hypothetical protein
MWKGAARPGCRWAVVLCLVVSVALGAPRPAQCATAYAPSPDEVALLVLANEARVKSGLTPYLWSDALGAAALAHSTDMATHDCFQHDSCNGETWWKRIARYYPNWTTLAENIGGGGTPRMMHDVWMNSPGHRAAILGAYAEFGAAIVLDQYKTSYATEDFASSGARLSYPTVPGAAVVPRVGYASDERELLLNYFHPSGAPRAVRALVGSSCVTLTKEVGSATSATYRTTRTFPVDGACVPVVFEVIRADGVRVRWPEDDAIVVGSGVSSLSCPAWTTDVPTQDCGGGGSLPTPTPTPTPAPTPAPGDLALSDVRIVVKPGKVDPSVGLVQVEATLPFVADFDPSTGPVSFDLSYGKSATWTEDLAETCGAQPCLKANARATTYRFASGSKVVLTFVLGPNERWKVRYTGRKETIGAVAAGPVDLTLTAGGRVFTASADGSLNAQGIVGR